MAFFEVEFKSEALKRDVEFNVILPVEKFKGPYPTLYLLHGLTDNRNGWIHNWQLSCLPVTILSIWTFW